MGPGDFFPTNLDLADILGRTDLDFENLYFWDFCWIPNSQISRSPDFQVPRNLAWAGLGPGWAGLGPEGPSACASRSQAAIVGALGDSRQLQVRRHPSLRNLS